VESLELQQQPTQRGQARNQLWNSSMDLQHLNQIFQETVD
jgi:hypothetical protein